VLFEYKSTNTDANAAGREIRAVMKAVSDMDVSAYDANKMIEAASGGASDTITFDEFKAILSWTAPPEDDFDSH